MSRNRVFTGPLAEHLRGLLEEKRSLGYKYEEQARLMSVLDEMSKQYDCQENCALLSWRGSSTGARQRKKAVLH